MAAKMLMTELVTRLEALARIISDSHHDRRDGCDLVAQGGDNGGWVQSVSWGQPGACHGAEPLWSDHGPQR